MEIAARAISMIVFKRSSSAMMKSRAMDRAPIPAISFNSFASRERGHGQGRCRSEAPQIHPDTHGWFHLPAKAVDIGPVLFNSRGPINLP
jgi:hypothetical protein